jgi:putative FmdB family regulatory protein
MPTYTYRCAQCGVQFDVHQSFSDAPLKVCEKCGGDLKKIINSVGIVFKGSGFYHNDSRSKASDSLQAKPQAHSDSPGGTKESAKETKSPRPSAVPGRVPTPVA